MRNKGLAALLLSGTALAVASPLFKGATNVLAAGIEGASLPSGWTLKTLDDSGSTEVTTPYLTGVAYKDNIKGNSIKLSRKQSANKLYALSDSFAAEADTSYKIEFFYRNECLDDPENVLSVTVLETLTDGSVVSAVAATKNGRNSAWTSVSGYYSTSVNCESLQIRIAAEGYGDFYVNDITLKGRPAPFVPVSNYTMMDVEDKEPFYSLNVSRLTDDCYRGERALALDQSGFRSCIGFLPVGFYTMKFRYKSVAGQRISVRLDNVTMAGQRSWNGAPVTGTTEGWAEYSYRFQKSATVECDISWFGIFAYGDYTIDDLAIYDDEGFNYVTNGTFEGYDLDGINLIGNASISEDKDGVLSYSGSYNNFHLNRETGVEFDSSAMNLEEGKRYTLSYDVRNGYGDSCGIASYNGVSITSGVGGNPPVAWERKEGSFTAINGQSLTLSLGQMGVSRVCYIRNVSIKDEEGNECLLSQPKVHVTDESQIGENIFNGGSFDYTFSENPESSSTFSDDSFDEDSSSDSSSSIWNPSTSSSNPSSSGSSKEDETKDDDEGNGDNGLVIGIGATLVALATAGLAVSIVFLLKGRKHD